MENNGEAKALPPVEIRVREKCIFNYDQKYIDPGAHELCPAAVPRKTSELLKKYALASHRILGVRGYSRSSFIVRFDWGIIF